MAPPPWPNENAYDAIVWAEADRNGVSPYLVKAVIGAESSYKPNARRPEAPRDSLPPTPDFPKGGDESRGLMQLLLRTARGLGYTGNLAGLDDPLLSIAYGTRLLANNYRATRNGALKNEPAARQWDAAIAAYNAGWSKQRAGDAPRTGNTIATPFTNQVYVDRVRRYERYFIAAQPGPAGPTPPPPPPPGATPAPDLAALGKGCATPAAAMASLALILAAAIVAALT